MLDRRFRRASWRRPAREIPFVFDTLDVDLPLVGQLLDEDPRQRIARTMPAAWVSFAAEGNTGWPWYGLDRRATMRSTRPLRWWTIPGPGSVRCGRGCACSRARAAPAQNAGRRAQRGNEPLAVEHTGAAGDLAPASSWTRVGSGIPATHPPRVMAG